MGLAGSMKRLEGKVEAVEVQNKEEEEEKVEEAMEEEECDVKQGIDQDELKYGEKNEPEGSMKKEEEGDMKEAVGDNLKDAKRNSFRLDYITDMIRR